MEHARGSVGSRRSARIFPGADDLGNMFQFYEEYETALNKTRDVDYSKQLNPELMNFEQWLDKYAGLIPL